MRKCTTFDATLYERSFEGYAVPEKLKRMAVTIMKRFVITGICDGMYICNVIANQNMMGDGAGHFNGEDHVIDRKTREFLSTAYSSNIRSDETDQKDLDEILRFGSLNSYRMHKGLTKKLATLRAEKKKCDIYRKEYIARQINFAKATLAEI